MRLERLLDVSIDRFDENPLITADPEQPQGDNVNGPSVIRCPDWVEEPLGRYYLYFAHHQGESIRLAYAEDLRGPWTVHPTGVLHLDDTQFDDHIASPDVQVDHAEGRLRLYFHGCCGPFRHDSGDLEQATDVAVSTDGLTFTPRSEILGTSYFEVWEYGDRYYALANDGHLYRGDDPLKPFDRRQRLFERNRHFATRLLEDDNLQVFLTRRGDRPERIMVAGIDLSVPDQEWRADPHPPETVLWAERRYEGGDLPLETSESGAIYRRVRALRDPAIFEEDDRTYLFYVIAGERGIAGAEVR